MLKESDRKFIPNSLPDSFSTSITEIQTADTKISDEEGCSDSDSLNLMYPDSNSSEIS